LEKKTGAKGYKKRIGKAGEKVARLFLEQECGWKIIEQNFSCSLGEIDLVAQDGSTVVFVEVRSTGTANFDLVEESINWQKQKKIKQLALFYLKKQKNLAVLSSRFDVLLVQINPETMEKQRIHWIKDAF